MSARLLYTDASGAAREVELPASGSFSIGRDPGADLVVENLEVSRRHASIHVSRLGCDLEDHASANGTWCNDRRVERRERLETGDRISLALAIDLCFETERSGRRARAHTRPHLRPAWLVALLCTGVALVGSAWIGAAQPDDPVLRHAAALASEGVRAHARGASMEARSKLRAAIGEVYQAGYLEDTPRGSTTQAAFALLEPLLDPPADLEDVFRAALASADSTAVGSGDGGCRLDAVAPADFDPCLRASVERVMRGLRQDPREVPPWFYREVGLRLSAERAFIASALARGRGTIPMLEHELRAANMPPLLHYVALIESGYRNDARSRAGAVGMWQFVASTARQYGLRITSDRDERRDTAKSTRAAARYLRDLTFDFGGDALLLALAGYNRGENGVRRALRTLESPWSDRSLWALIEGNLLPRETADYLPRYMAAAVAGEAGLPSDSQLRAAGY